LSELKRTLEKYSVLRSDQKMPRYSPRRLSKAGKFINNVGCMGICSQICHLRRVEASGWTRYKMFRTWLLFLTLSFRFAMSSAVTWCVKIRCKVTCAVNE